jgi:multidrug transporter EmrE-like cation transporter
VFTIAGCVDFSLKLAQESGALRGPFLLVVFATACASSVAIAIATRRAVRARDVTIGAVLGIPNFFASYFLLHALEALPGIVVFPAANASIVVGVSIAAMIVWREFPTVRAATGLALGIAAVVLLGLGSR